MTERRTVPVAYVTKWAATRGILVVKDGEDMGDGHLSWGPHYTPRRHWTEDRAEAERRWWKAMEATQKRLERQEAKLAKALKAGPKWEES